MQLKRSILIPLAALALFGAGCARATPPPPPPRPAPTPKTAPVIPAEAKNIPLPKTAK